MKFKDTARLTNAELADLIKRLERLENERRHGELTDKPIWLVIDGAPVRVVLPDGHIRQNFMSAVGHSLRFDKELAKARLAGRVDATPRTKRASRADVRKATKLRVAS